MIDWSPDDLRAAWTRRFLKSGGNGDFTRLFGDHTPAMQDRLLAEFPLGADEAPVFGSYEKAGEAVLVTTGRIRSTSSGVLAEVAIASVEDVTIDIEALKRAGKRKSEWDELQVVTQTGQRFPVRLEPGRPFFGVWNALKFIPGRRRDSK